MTTENRTIYKCPHCGWEYDPSINGHGWGLVPNHRMDGTTTCPGQGQTPRNAATDRRPLWKDLPDDQPA